MLKSIIKTVKPARMWIDGKPYNIKRLTNKDRIKLKKNVTQNALLAGAKTSSVAVDSIQKDCVDKEGVPKVIDVEIAEKSDADGARETATLDEKDCDRMSIEENTETEECSTVDKADTEVLFDVTLKDGKYTTGFRLPVKYYLKLGYLPGTVLRNISTNTNTTIHFPRRGKDGEITIMGENKEDVCEARDELHSVVSDIRDSLAPNHFIALPILSEEIKTSFKKFKSDVLALDDIQGMDESIFMKTEKLHLTVVVFALLNDAEKEEATKALEDYKTNVLNNIINERGTPIVKVSGIEIMNNNPKKVDVLYAKVKLVDEDESHSLQKIVDGISDYFYDRGLVSRYKENVKLHMTLINTKYRKPGKKQSIDASKILENFGDYDFGTCPLESIRLSLISSQGEDGFYQSLTTIGIP